jgi:hypothetical protein
VKPTDLELYLLLRVTVANRDAEGTRQALRHIAEQLPDQEGHKIVGQIRRTMPGSCTLWLSQLR